VLFQALIENQMSGLAMGAQSMPDQPAEIALPIRGDSLRVGIFFWP